MIGDRLGLGFDPGDHAAYEAKWTSLIERDPRSLFRAARDAGVIEDKIMSFERETERGQAHESNDNHDQEAVIMPSIPSVSERHPAMTASGDQRTFLVVPFTEKGDAKAAGARWDKAEKAWYVPAGVPLDGFAAWMPSKGSVHIEVDVDPREQFAQTLRDAGFQLQAPPVMDGTMQRISVEGDHGHERSGAYKAYLDGLPAGYFENFRTSVKTNWKASGKVAALSAQDRARMAAETAEKRIERAHQREKQYERTAQEVSALWAAAAPAKPDHPYLAAKGVEPHGLAQDALGNLLVPVQDANGNLWSLQKITPAGQKGFKENGKAEGGHFVIGNLSQPGPLLIVEGVATAATVHELTGQPAIVAFNAGNLVKVAAVYRERFPDRTIHIAGDNDHAREAAGKPNIGKIKAEKAARAVGGRALLPIFATVENGSDWNDLARNRGKDDARMWLRGAMRVAEHYMAAEKAGQSAEKQSKHENDRTPNKELERELER